MRRLSSNATVTITRASQPFFDLVTLNLARGAARKIVECHECDPPRPLVARQLATADRLHIGLGHRSIMRRDESDWNLAPLVVLLTHDDRVRDAGVREQHALDLG